MKRFAKHAEQIEDWPEERRDGHRLAGPNGAFVALFKRGSYDFVKMGKLVDINNNGLALHYIAGGDEPSGPFDAIVFGGDDSPVRTEKIPCRIIYDHEVPDESWCLLQLRRCGLQFGLLTQKQHASVAMFMDGHRLPKS